MDHEDISTFISCAREIETREKAKIGKKSIKWFVSSDEFWVIDYIRNRTKQELVSSRRTKIAHTVFDIEAYEAAILDVELLSRCDRLVITGGSTFGFMAAFKSQQMPYYVDGKRAWKSCALFEFSTPSRRPTGEAVF